MRLFIIEIIYHEKVCICLRDVRDMQKEKKRRSNRIIPTELSPMKFDVRILIKARGGINRCAILLKDRVY